MPKRTKPKNMDPPPAAEVEEAEGDDALNLDPNSTEDICKTLLDRYAKSSAPQHCHLCASACAMRSILTDEGLPLTPAAYFAAVLTAIRDADHADRNGVAALSAFLSILLPLVPVGSMPPSKAKDASLAVVEILKAPLESVAATTVRSLVKCLGFLVLCLDFGDWGAVEVPLEVLFKFAMDRRPKVRKCAQVSIEKAFVAFSTSKIIKKAGKFQLSMFRSYISLDSSEESRKKRSPKSEHIEALHLLNVVAHVVPKLPKKTITKFLPEICKLLGCRFSLFTRHVLTLLGVLLEHLDIDELISEADRIISVLSSYLSFTKMNPVDTILSASNLLKKVLNKLHPSMPSLWIGSSPLIFSSLAGFLDLKAVTSKHAADILVELINCHIDHNIFPIDAKISCSDKMLCSPESRAIVSVCTMLENTLGACSGVSNEHILEVLIQMFLKLGDMSHCFMPNIVHKLSKLALQTEDSAYMNHLHECIGSAVIAMGPEKMLSLLPISLNEENFTCSNTWLIPILRKYTSGASLKFFVEHIAPIAKSLKATCKKVKGSKDRKELQSCIQGLWDLLPAFCHYPIDTSQNFDFLAQFLVSKLKKDPSTHETIVAALQVLVNENRNMLQASQDVKSAKVIVNGAADDIKSIKYTSLRSCYTKEVASKNIKAMASCSVDLLEAIIDVFFVSTPEKRIYLKEAIECLSSIMGASDGHKFVFSLLENFEDVRTVSESEDSVRHFPPSATSEDVGKSNEEMKNDKNRCLAMELVSCFIVGLNEDLVYKIYNCIRHFLSVNDGNVHCESYFTLSRILKEHSWFSSEKAAELIDLVIGVKSTSDIRILRSRFCCLHFLLVHLMKSEEEEEKKKIFLILNETILTLKDSDKEVRKTAYDMLLGLACSLRDPQSGNFESQLNELLTMIMGYFSGSSPQITSGAVAALSLFLYKDADLCLSVQELLTSVLSLLNRKQIEVIKAVLGFIKVLVSSLHANELSRLLPDIANGALPWSLVSKNHFREKVRLIFEIIIRKCGADSVNMVVPDKYRSFIKTIEEHRRNRATSKRDGNPCTAPMSGDSPHKGAKKRKHGDMSTPSGNKDFQPSRKAQKGNEHKKNVPSKNKPRPVHDERGRRHHMNSRNSAVSRAPTRGKYNNKRVRMDEKPRGRIKKMQDKRKHLKSDKTLETDKRVK